MTEQELNEMLEEVRPELVRRIRHSLHSDLVEDCIQKAMLGFFAAGTWKDKTKEHGRNSLIRRAYFMATDMGGKSKRYKRALEEAEADPTSPYYQTYTADLEHPLIPRKDESRIVGR